MVYVLDNHGQPLMPTNRHGKVRHLLKDGKAKVVKRCPFTIKLMYETTHYTQPLTLGVDTGSGTMGTAVATEDHRIVYASEVAVRNDIAKKMERRSKYRRNRRNRKTRYRPVRWANRGNSIKKGRFSPTMRSKIHSHVKEIEYIKSILPITSLVLELGQFDTHLMKNPSLANPKIRHWGYQQGPNYGYENTKAMVLSRDNYNCRHCNDKHKDRHLEVHHIIFRSQGGSDEPENLITLCRTCHTDLHAGKYILNAKGKLKGTLKYATQMNSIRKQLLIRYPSAIETFGYVTKANRQQLNIPKEHFYDACTIASEGHKFAMCCNLLKKKCVPEGDFQQTKGVRSEQRITTSKIRGFRKFDKVKYFGKVCFIKGRRTSGTACLMDINGNPIDFSYMPKGFKTPKMSQFKRLSARTSWMVIEVGLSDNAS